MYRQSMARLVLMLIVFNIFFNWLCLFFKVTKQWVHSNSQMQLDITGVRNASISSKQIARQVGHHNSTMLSGTINWRMTIKTDWSSVQTLD